MLLSRSVAVKGIKRDTGWENDIIRRQKLVQLCGGDYRWKSLRKEVTWSQNPGRRLGFETNKFSSFILTGVKAEGMVNPSSWL